MSGTQESIEAIFAHRIEMITESHAQKMGNLLRPAPITIRDAVIAQVIHRLSTDDVNEHEAFNRIPRRT